MFSKGRAPGLGMPSIIRPYASKANKGDKNTAQSFNLSNEGVTEKESVSSPRASNQVAESPVCVPGTYADDLPAEVPLDEWLQRVQDARDRLAQTHGEGRHTLEWQKQWDPPRVRTSSLVRTGLGRLMAASFDYSNCPDCAMHCSRIWARCTPCGWRS